MPLLPSHCARLLLCLTGIATCSPSQDTSVLAGKCVVDVSTGDTTSRLLSSRYVRCAQPMGQGVYTVLDTTVDAARGEILTIAGSELILKTIAGEILWRRALGSLGISAKGAAQWRLLSATRVILSRSEGGWIALRRDSGKTVWQTEQDPAQQICLDRDLVLTAGTLNDEFVLRARSLKNGGVAFAAKLSEAPLRVIAAPHGVAVRGRSRVVVFDRFGPKLFEHEIEADLVSAGPDGWVAMSSRDVTSLDRRGGVRWRIPRPQVKFMNRHRLDVTATGDVLITSNHFMSDSGVHSRALHGKDGTERWRVQLPGLGIPHSKYWHDVYTRLRAGRIDIVSQAGGGAFVVVLDTESGETVLRSKVK